MDSIKAVWHGLPELQAEFTRIDRSVNRASMYAVRQAGRKVKQVAKRNAPVYRGKRADIPKGRLKNSIHSDKKLRGGAGTYSVRVGPRGYPASAYAPKQEARTPYMRPAFEQVAPQLRGIAELAWTRASRGRR
jgi:HK97 gp10 family phage protein